MTAIQNRETQTPVVQLEPPRFVDGKPLLIAGLRCRYAPATLDTISAQWQRFAAYIGRIPGQVGRTSYGLNFLYTVAQGIEYVSGVEVSSCTGLPAELSCVNIPAQRYAVFVHGGHVSKAWETCAAIEKEWALSSGHEPAQPPSGAPAFFERYTEKFDPRTGIGGIEIWVPIKS